MNRWRNLRLHMYWLLGLLSIVPQPRDIVNGPNVVILQMISLDWAFE